MKTMTPFTTGTTSMMIMTAFGISLKLIPMMIWMMMQIKTTALLSLSELIVMTGMMMAMIRM